MNRVKDILAWALVIAAGVLLVLWVGRMIIKNDQDVGFFVGTLAAVSSVIWAALRVSDKWDS